MLLTVNRNAALGNGTREKGEALAEILGGISLEDVEKELSKNGKCASLVIFAGVEDVEVLTLLKNPDFCQLVNKTGEKTDEKAKKPTKKKVAKKKPAKKKTTENSVDLLGLSDGVAEKLNAAGLKTAEDVLEYGNKNKGLASIEGIDEVAQDEIIRVLKDRI